MMDDELDLTTAEVKWLEKVRSEGRGKPRVKITEEHVEVIQPMADMEAKPDRCTCPTLDGVPVTGASCPVHGFKQTTLSNEDIVEISRTNPPPMQWYQEIFLQRDITGG